tara:strand:+ start:19825 stop:20445 length:621 start_codon:yes stop_codon:yes gene_type:complete
MNDGYADILNSIASSDPTPGGGSVAALALSHAHALAAMVSRLTIGREKWKDGHATAEEIIANSEERIEESIVMAREDAESFDRVMMAYRLPRNNEDEIEARKASIRDATIGAANSPLNIANSSLQLLDSIIDLAKFGNSNALTDLAASAELAKASFVIASMNVRINLDSIDGKECESISSRLSSLESDVDARYANLREIIDERLGW